MQCGHVGALFCHAAVVASAVDASSNLQTCAVPHVDLSNHVNS